MTYIYQLDPPLISWKSLWVHICKSTKKPCCEGWVLYAKLSKVNSIQYTANLYLNKSTFFDAISYWRLYSPTISSTFLDLYQIYKRCVYSCTMTEVIFNGDMAKFFEREARNNIKWIDFFSYLLIKAFSSFLLFLIFLLYFPYELFIDAWLHISFSRIFSYERDSYIEVVFEGWWVYYPIPKKH